MSAVRRRPRGFTMIEVAVTLAVLGMSLAAFARAFATGAGLATTSRAALFAHDDARRSLDAISSVLRGAHFLSLGGFDELGVATAPVFQRAIGTDPDGIVLDAPEVLSWRAVAPLDGIASPGEVVLTKNGTSTVIAPRVPSGGFRVVLSGNTLRIALTTYSSTSQRQ